MYIQKKSLVSKWCFVAATPIHIHHHTSNHNLTIFLFVFMFCIQHSAAAIAAVTFRHSWHVMADLKAFVYLLYLNTCTTKVVQLLDKTVPYRVSQEERAKLREGVPYVKLYRYNPKHLYPKLNSYGDNGRRKVWTSCIPVYCTSIAV